MFFSARKVKAEKHVDRKEPLISKSDIINLLKEAFSGIDDSSSK